VRRLAVTLLFTVLLYLVAAPAPSGAISGSIVVSQLLLYDNPDGCTSAPCGFSGVVGPAVGAVRADARLRPR